MLSTLVILTINTTMSRIIFSLLVLTWNSAFTQKYNITRLSDGIYTRRPDIVEIPQSLCSDTKGDVECPRLDGRKIGDCKCACSNREEFTSGDIKVFIYNASTFGFYNGMWKCEKNTAVRQHAGCSLSVGLDQEQYRPIATLPSSTTVETEITKPTNGDTMDDTTCTVDAGSSMYMKCNGDWKPLNSTVVSKRFNTRIDNEVGILYLKVDGSGRLAYPLPSGRVIKLGLICRNAQRHCILLKIEGSIQCAVSTLPSSSSSSTQASTTQSIIETSTYAAQRTSSLTSLSIIPTRSSSASTEVSSHPVSLSSATTTSLQTSPKTISPSSTSAVVALSPTSTSNVQTSSYQVNSTVQTSPHRPTKTTTPTTPPKVRKASGKGQSKNNMGTVGLILAGVTVFAIIIIVLIVIITKRRINVSSQSHSNVQIVENDSYEQGIDNSFEFKDGDQQSVHEYYTTSPTRQAPGSQKKDIKHPFKGGNRNSISNQFYGSVEVLDKPQSDPSTAKHFNNVPEESIFETIKSTKGRNEPSGPRDIIRNSLEAPSSHEEPIYNEPEIMICETPNGTISHDESRSENTYDVLERPQPSRESLYGVLIRQDAPHIYGTLKQPNSDDPIYDYLEDGIDGTLNDDDEIYQYVA